MIGPESGDRTPRGVMVHDVDTERRMWLEMAVHYWGTEKTIIFIIWPIACSITLLHTVRMLPERRRGVAVLQTATKTILHGF